MKKWNDVIWNIDNEAGVMAASWQYHVDDIDGEKLIILLLQ